MKERATGRSPERSVAHLKPKEIVPMKPLHSALLLVVACSSERAPRLSPAAGALTQQSLAASLAAGRSAAEAASYTTPWADSSRLGDTVFYSRGRVVTTVAVHTDSQWAVLPVTRVAIGIPYGPTQLPADSLCTLGYTGTTLAVVASTVLGELARTRECGGKTFAQIRRARLKDGTGNLSVQAARTELNGWPWSGICARVKDSTIVAFHIGDDVTADEWGPAPLATRLAQWDSIASSITTRCPGAAVVIRARPTQLEARSRWQWLTTAWAQYPGPRPRSGTPEQFFSTEVASARRQHLGLVAGVNLLSGGCGPTTLGRCLPGVPGMSEPNVGDDMYQLSAAELIYYKTVAMSDPYVCASVDWAWGPTFKSDFHARPEIRSAMKALGVVAGQRPRTSCVL
jgi:hypothetical protein